MIMVDGKVFMEQYNNYPRIFISAFLLYGSVQAAAETPVGAAQTTQFIATIADGSCRLDYGSEPVLTFMPRIAADFSPGKTVEIQPVSAVVTCNYAVTPQVMVSGTTPYASNNLVFLDNNSKWPDGTNGVGFMVQPARSVAERDTPPSLSNFYTEGIAGKAIANGETVSLLPLNDSNDFTENQVLWVGLVGLTDSSNTLPGAFQATLTITGIIP